MADDPATLLAEARRRHRSGDTEGALRGYRTCLESAPDKPEIRLLAAMAAAQTGRLEEAVAHARHAMSLRDDPASRLTLGRILLQAGRAEEALACLGPATTDPAMAPDANFHVGQALRGLGRHADAAAALEAAVNARPDHGPAWNELGVARMWMGQVGEGVEAFRRSLAARPGDPGVLSNLANACLRLGEIETAEKTVVDALEIDPASPRALAVLARIERSRGRLVEAIAAWERCVRVDAGSADAWSGLGSARQAAGDLGGAGEAYRRSLELAPGNADALAGLAEWHEWQGRYREGLEVLRDAPGAPAFPGVDLAAGRLLRRLGRSDEARRRLEAAVPAPTGDSLLRRQFAFSLGDVCDELGDVAEAWHWYQEGNRLAAARFDPSEHGRWLARLESLTPERQGGDGGAGIVFIVGMPRSGTTLVEQILAAHPGVAAAGELPTLGRLVQAFDTCSTGAAAPGDPGRLVAERYLEGVAEIRGAAAVMTDKMPLNYQYVGLIGAVLPEARIVHCRRDPRDTALSCFFTDFIDPALGFATRLDWLAEYIIAYRQFMGRRRDDLAGRMLDLDYEFLVEDPPAAIRRLLEFVGLPWDEACMAHSSLERTAATASHAQVRRPIYRSSVGRWKAYEAMLAPLLGRLETGSA